MSFLRWLIIISLISSIIILYIIMTKWWCNKKGCFSPLVMNLQFHLTATINKYFILIKKVFIIIIFKIFILDNDSLLIISKALNYLLIIFLIILIKTWNIYETRALIMKILFLIDIFRIRLFLLFLVSERDLHVFVK